MIQKNQINIKSRGAFTCDIVCLIKRITNMNKKQLRNIFWGILVLALVILGQGLVSSDGFKSLIGFEKTRNAVQKP